MTKNTYYCLKCKSPHKFDSKIGREHMKVEQLGWGTASTVENVRIVLHKTGEGYGMNQYVFRVKDNLIDHEFYAGNTYAKSQNEAKSDILNSISKSSQLNHNRKEQLQHLETKLKNLETTNPRFEYERSILQKEISKFIKAGVKNSK